MNDFAMQNDGPSNVLWFVNCPWRGWVIAIDARVIADQLHHLLRVPGILILLKWMFG